jgi:hypothetical protein
MAPHPIAAAQKSDARQAKAKQMRNASVNKIIMPK